ncbi:MULTISPECIES: hypothetical protein [unclassified Lysinibacillus]|uniref:hypothetical protein n=1 Tax=unclassified Lysinibacillus TaxID=2636778 RepID=UPI0037F3E0ED
MAKISPPIVDKSFFMKLLQLNILINLGYIYGAQDNQHVRLSYAYASREKLQYGIEMIVQVAKSHLKKLY